jgi:Fe-S-cluster-containing dehydrogenase component
MSESTDCSSSCEGDCSRRNMVKGLAVGAAAIGVGAGVMASGTITEQDQKEREMSGDEFDGYFKKNYRVMTESERQATIARFELKARERYSKAIHMSGSLAEAGVLFGYAFNLSRCNGSRKCVQACVEENNQDRATDMQYIRMIEMEKGTFDVEHGTADYDHVEVPDGKFFFGTQCHQCENPPCVKVCPVGATWKENDGIVVIDYDWCVGCRYCQAACPYFARRFNWQEPSIADEEVNPDQHILGNQVRSKGVMEKCTFCIQRSREGQNPACVEACPTGARIFGNLLDPESEIRNILANKKVFRFKEELGTEPKFWYFMD